MSSVNAIEQRVAEILYNIPSLIAAPFETNFKADSSIQFARDNYWLAYTLVALYMIFCFVGSKVMRSREPFNLRYPLALWNAGLSLFSFIGMCKTVPHLLGFLLTHTYEETICSNPLDSFGVGPTGFWVMAFIYSKIPELIDTVFIVLRKKPLIFLHWYHHVTVLLYCWDAYSTLAGSGLYFVAMNYSVHALMYGYYCLQALHLCPKWFPTYLITMSQIAQMFVGTFVCISSWYYKFNGSQCNNTMSNLTAGAIMYGSYLYLFVDFAVNRFIRKKAPKKSVKKSE